MRHLSLPLWIALGLTVSVALGLTVFLGGPREGPAADAVGGSVEDSPSPSPRRQLVLQAPPAGAVNSVTVSPDGSLVATGANEGGVRLYDANTGALLRVIGEAGDRSVAFAPDGRSLAAGGFHMDRLVGVHDVRTGRRVRALAGHTQWEAYATAFSPDGKLLASAGADRQV